MNNDLTVKEKKKLSKMFPNLKKFKKKHEKNSDSKFRLRIVDVNKQNFLENLVERTEKYLTQISDQFKKIEQKDDKIESLNHKIDVVLDNLQIKEQQRRKVAGKVGGLQACLNKEKTKTEKLLQDKINLENTIELKNLEIETKDAEIKILKGKGEKKNLEDYKNYNECRHELEKRKREKTSYGKI